MYVFLIDRSCATSSSGHGPLIDGTSQFLGMGRIYDWTDSYARSSSLLET